MKSGCVLSLSLLPQQYMMERINRSETVIVLSNAVVGEFNPVNKHRIRTAIDHIWALTIPLVRENLPADKCEVMPGAAWRRFILNDVSKAYGGLLHSRQALELADKCLPKVRHPWLVDILMHTFINLLEELHWDKEIIRGDSLQRRRYKDESEFLLNLALEREVDVLIVGYKQMKSLDQRLFRKNSVKLVEQHWQRPKNLGKTDSFLDVVARMGIDQAKAML